MRRAWKAAKEILSYLGALALTVIFALYLSGRTGWFFFAVMMIYPVSSAAMAYISKRFLTIEASVSDTELYKGSKTKVKVTIKNRSFLPSPPVVIELLTSDALSADSEKCVVNIMPRKEQTVEIYSKANIWCAAYAGIKSIKITDLTGLFSFPFKIELSELTFKINIIPNAADISSSDGLIKFLSDSSAYDDDSEDTRDSHALSFNGTPGFDHREYIPGDPIRRINWKLSCKRNTYMVRLDDELLSSRHTVVLDSVNSSGNDVYGELCGESMLGMLKVIVRIGIAANVWYYSENEWKCAEILNENDVEQLRFALAGYGFLNKISQRVPTDEINNHGEFKSMIFYTPYYDKTLAKLLHVGNASSKTESTITAAASAIDKEIDAPEIWILKEGGISHENN